MYIITDLLFPWLIFSGCIVLAVISIKFFENSIPHPFSSATTSLLLILYLLFNDFIFLNYNI